ncbi:hypothetical protein Q4E93_12400 [Flavitalea sp. BT771]|uniref:hypothetical protein n=1 Tax=Flavitalea sp. BT771 TaxID=3063329 RepID=UPI0026E1A4A4|nr:hypothetical protein [Flavitalea sp. BT771]MDO6431396.1 hypothetical protein [Flavitalea sp. BT771]MDV6220304.1 hypothetical protein [Flavitalea sp. BT771]
MSVEAHIRTILENYLNLESALKGYSQAKEEASKKYDSLLNKHNPPGHTHTIHSAAPILSAYDEMKNLDKCVQDTNHKLNETGEIIKEYIHALKGSALDVTFTFDSLNHRAGIHTFYLENEELKTRHLPVS